MKNYCFFEILESSALPGLSDSEENQFSSVSEKIKKGFAYNANLKLVQQNSKEIHFNPTKEPISKKK